MAFIEEIYSPLISMRVEQVLATEFTFQEIYDQLKEDIEKIDPDVISDKLENSTTSTPDLNTDEPKPLDKLLSKYNPLN